MSRIAIFGNSGSGKSTYALALASQLNCHHLDLDTVAWETDVETPTRRSIDEVRPEIDSFINSEKNWVVEGCYADLLEMAIIQATEIIFLNPGTDTCIENARSRPWETHKYNSREAQDANLTMLIDWIKDYHQRTDEFSYIAHRRLFERFAGRKQEFNANQSDFNLNITKS